MLLEELLRVKRYSIIALIRVVRHVLMLLDVSDHGGASGLEAFPLGFNHTICLLGDLRGQRSS